MLINTSASPVTTIATVLASIGAINWGLVGLFDFNLVSFIFGMSMLTKIIYSLVGLSGLYCFLVLVKACCKPSVEQVK